MALPFFYIDEISTGTVVLDEDTSKHVTQVLRMKTGEQLLLTNGRGIKATSEIIDDHRKRCTVRILASETEEQLLPKVAVAISLVKNNARFEWFLEKATEIGVNEIIPLVCERTEKEKFRQDRLQHILISAMLQSQQSWLPILHQPTSFEEVVLQSVANKEVQQAFQFEQRFIAHCLPEQKQQLPALARRQSSIILIGPEGDFTLQEINLALQHNFQPVALGNTRLRTETAGMVAATLLRNV